MKRIFNLMKNVKKLLLLITCFFIQVLFSQNDIVVFNDGNEKFYLYINGVKQNADPETNVRVSNIKQPWVKIKVVFVDNKRIPDLMANAQFMWEGEEKKSWEFVYQIVNKTGKYKIKPYSAAPITNNYPESQTTVNYSSSEVQPATSSSTPAQSSQTVSSTTVVTTSVPANANSDGTANINISISPVGAGIHIQDGISSTNSNAGYTTSVVSTTVLSSSSSASGVSSPSPVSSQQQPSQPSISKCVASEKEFEGIKKNISSKSFEDSKLTIAKQISDSKCLKSIQVRDIMKLFSFEETRLEFAKYAYNKVIDKESYYQVNDAFQFENSIEELNESIGK